LQAEHKRLAFHIENTPLGFIEWDNQLHIKSLSKQAEEIFGWSIEEFSENEKTGYNQVYEEDQPWVFKISEQLLSGEVERNKVLNRNYTKDGRVIWCEWFNSVLKDKDGKVITIMSLVQDVTERKTIEERLAYNETSLKEAQAIARVGNWEINMVRNSQVWSDEMYNIFGIDKAEVTPSPELFLSFIHPGDSAYAIEKVGEAFKTLQNSSFDFRFIRKDGVIRHGYSEWSFEFDKNRNPVRLFGIVQDITERKLAEMERTKMVNELMLRNKDLEQFAYIISHNLRAPVANILGAANELKVPGLSAEEKDLLGQGLNESVSRLDNVVKDLNYILQVKHNINEPKEKVCFSELVDEIKISVKNLIDKEHIEIKYDFSEIDELLTIKSYLYSIFYNLISNSIKYRQQQVPNVIEIKSHSEKNKLQLVFSDNGTGIDLEKRGDQVFGLYKQFHANTEGKGMGLFMVKTQVETLGGKISVKSGINKGTEFKIEFEK
jgi:PAS domain S-box-containing protein